MKKLSIVVAALVIAGMANSWAQEVDSFLVGPVNITLAGKTTKLDAATGKASSTVANAASINSAAVQYAVGQRVFHSQVCANDACTNFISIIATQVVYAIGSGLSTATFTNGGTNTYFTGTVIWGGENDFSLNGNGRSAVVTKSTKNGNTTLVFLSQEQFVNSFVVTNGVVEDTSTNVVNSWGVITNSELLATITVSTSKSKTNVSGKVSGTWNSTQGSAFTGSIKAAKK